MHYLPGPDHYNQLSTDDLRQQFLVDGLFEPGQLRLRLTDLDRAVLGGAVPTDAALQLSAPDELRCAYFCERRELGILNIGGAGQVIVDGASFELASLDCLYVGRSCKEVSFVSSDAEVPAQFYLLSYPAHRSCPTQLARHADATAIDLGADETANRRTIYQYIHEDGIDSCQLVMGFTKLQSGSVWNTMPCHTHARRTEIYMYFDVPTDQQILHIMGRPQETRCLWMSDRSAVLSPAWSVHSAAGTSSYAFVWGMGGENKTFADMDGVAITELR